MPYTNFDTWMKTKKTVNVKIMDQNQVIANINDAKIMVGIDFNGSGYPCCFKVFNGNASINIGDRYINQIIESGEYWCVFVDGYEHYLIS